MISILTTVCVALAISKAFGQTETVGQLRACAERIPDQAISVCRQQLLSSNALPQPFLDEAIACLNEPKSKVQEWIREYSTCIGEDLPCQKFDLSKYFHHSIGKRQAQFMKGLIQGMMCLKDEMQGQFEECQAPCGPLDPVREAARNQCMEDIKASRQSEGESMFGGLKSCVQAAMQRNSS